MLDKLKNTLNHWLEPQTVTVGEAVAQWTKVSQLKPGMKIAVVENSHPGGAPSVTLGVALDSPGVEWDEIASIKEVGRERVYDIEIDGTRNFVAGHYINQNTGKALTTQQEAAYSEYLTTKKSACADSGDSTNVGSNLDCHLDSNLQQQRNFVNTQNKGVEVAGFAPAEPWVTIQVPHLGTPTPSPLSQILGEDINEKNIIYGGIIAHNTTIADTGLGYNFQFGSGGVTLSTSGTSGLNIDTFGQLSLTSNQGATNALELVSTAGGIDISTGSGTQDIDILSGDAINLKSVGGAINLSAGSPTIASGITLATTGSVGIGDSGPDALLDIAGTTEQLRLAYENTDTNYASFTVDSSGNLTVNVTGTKIIISDDLQISGGDLLDSTATTRLSLGSTTLVSGDFSVTGNTGLGDTTPDAKLDIEDANLGYNFLFGSSGITLSTSGTSGINVDTFGQLSLTTNQGAANALELVSTAGGIDISTGSGTADIDILGGDAINLKAGTNGINLSAGTPTHGSGLLVNSSGDVQIGTNTLFADVSAGNVGIGTTVPGGILHTKSNDLGVILQTSSGTTKRMQTIYQDSAGTQTGRIGVDISGANDDDLQFVAGSGTTPMLHIEADGNVGIGDDTPDALLDVNGDLNVGTTTVVVTSATGDIVAGDSSSVLDWDASNQALYLQHSEADAVGLTIRSRKSRGSLASPTVITSGDYLLLINGYGYDGTAWEESSRIMLDTEGTVSTGIVPGIMRFYTQSTAGALTERMTIDSAGNVGIGDNSPTEAELVIGSAGAGSIYLTLSTAGTTNNAVCWDNAGATLLYDCDSTPADYMEFYSVEDGVETGDLVAPGTTMITTTTGEKIAKLTKTRQAYQGTIIGIVSDPAQAGDFNSIGQNINAADNPMPVALAGRVPVKIDPDSAPIEIGDFLTSSDKPGLAMKATKAGYTLGKALESWQPGGPATILAFVSLGYYNPDLALTDTGDLTIAKIANSSTSEESSPVGAPPSEESLGDLSNSILHTSYSILNTAGETITRVAAFTDAAIANLKAGFISVKELTVEDTFISPVVYTNQLVADTITASSSAFGTLLAQDVYTEGLQARSATISSLVADTIEATTISAKYVKADHIEGLDAKFGLISNDLEATLSALLTQSVTTNVANASSNIAIDNGFIDATAGFFREFLAVTGKASFTEAEIATNLVVGSSLALDHNSISVLTDSTLFIQPTGQGRVSLMADLMTLDNTGQVTVTGNLTVAGQLTIGGVPSATPEVAPALAIKSGFGDIVASIDASGAATFTKLIIASAPVATTSGESKATPEVNTGVKTNASVGLATLPAGLTQIQVLNTQVTGQSLIYLTPTSPTQNQVLYLKTKKAGDSFTVAIDQSIVTDIQFQYWIIN